MSKHNYSQYSNNKKKFDETAQAVEETVVEETVAVEEPVTVEETAVETAPIADVETGKKRVKPAAKPAIATGVVANCMKLNVRAKADATADVVCVLDVASEVKIDVSKSTKDWFSVCTATGIEGYCMRKFVEANL